MSIEERLATAGYALPAPVAPVGAYVPVVHMGTTIYTSGQLPMVQGALPTEYKGAVGEDVDLDTARRAAAQCAVNALAAIKGAIGDLDLIDRVVKVTGFVFSPPSFTGQPEVMNGASELLRDALGERGVHARSAVGVAALPRGACVEVEMIVTVRPDVVP